MQQPQQRREENVVSTRSMIRTMRHIAHTAAGGGGGSKGDSTPSWSGFETPPSALNSGGRRPMTSSAAGGVGSGRSNRGFASQTRARNGTIVSSAAASARPVSSGGGRRSSTGGIAHHHHHHHAGGGGVSQGRFSSHAAAAAGAGGRVKVPLGHAAPRVGKRPLTAGNNRNTRSSLLAQSNRLLSTHLMASSNVNVHSAIESQQSGGGGGVQLVKAGSGFLRSGTFGGTFTQHGVADFGAAAAAAGERPKTSPQRPATMASSRVVLKQQQQEQQREEAEEEDDDTSPIKFWDNGHGWGNRLEKEQQMKKDEEEGEGTHHHHTAERPRFMSGFGAGNRSHLDVAADGGGAKAAGLFAWGMNVDGQCGVVTTAAANGYPDRVQSPRRVALTMENGQKLASFASGARHSFAITDKGCVYGWGACRGGDDDVVAQQKNAAAEGNNTCCSSNYMQPTLMPFLSHLKVWRIACGRAHSLLVTTFGALYSWGDNDLGQLGVVIGAEGGGGNTNTTSSAPRRTVGGGGGGARSVSALINAAGADFSRAQQQTKTAAVHHVASLRAEAVLDVACGLDHSAALTAQGRVFTWGEGRSGQLGTRGVIAQVVAQANAEASIAGPSMRGGGSPTTTATTATTTTTSVTTPTAVRIDRSSLDAATADPRRPPPTTHRRGGGGNDDEGNDSNGERHTKPFERIKQVACGHDHTILVTEAGELFVMGESSRGQLGLSEKVVAAASSLAVAFARTDSGNSADHQSSMPTPGPVFPTPHQQQQQQQQQVPPSAAVSANSRVAAAGAVRSLVFLPTAVSEFRRPPGSDGNTAPKKPRNDSSSCNENRIAVISAAGSSSFGITDGGDLFAWGANSRGQLGLGHTRDERFATQVAAFAEVGVRLGGINASEHHSIAVSTAGNVYVWGHAVTASEGPRSKNSAPHSQQLHAHGGALDHYAERGGYQAIPYLLEVFAARGVRISRVHAGGAHCLAAIESSRRVARTAPGVPNADRCMAYGEGINIASPAAERASSFETARARAHGIDLTFQQYVACVEMNKANACGGGDGAATQATSAGFFPPSGNANSNSNSASGTPQTPAAAANASNPLLCGAWNTFTVALIDPDGKRAPLGPGCTHVIDISIVDHATHVKALDKKGSMRSLRASASTTNNHNTGGGLACLVEVTEMVGKENEGLYQVRYRCQSIGQHWINIALRTPQLDLRSGLPNPSLFNTRPIAHSPFPVTLVPMKPSPDRCVVKGAGLRGSEAGERGEITIDICDVQGRAVAGVGCEALRVLLVPEGGPDAKQLLRLADDDDSAGADSDDIALMESAVVANVRSTSASSGSFCASYRCDRAGACQIWVQLSSAVGGEENRRWTHLSMSPYAATVVPGPVSAPHCVAAGDGVGILSENLADSFADDDSSLKSGLPSLTPHFFTITPRDRFGNDFVRNAPRRGKAAAQAPPTFKVQVSCGTRDTPCSLSRRGDGSVEAVYHPPRPGMHLVAVLLCGSSAANSVAHICGSPFRVEVAPPRQQVSADNCTGEGQGLWCGMSGRQTSFTLHAVDAHGAPVAMVPTTPGLCVDGRPTLSPSKLSPSKINPADDPAHGLFTGWIHPVAHDAPWTTAPADKSALAEQQQRVSDPPEDAIDVHISVAKRSSGQFQASYSAPSPGLYLMRVWVRDDDETARKLAATAVSGSFSAQRPVTPAAAAAVPMKLLGKTPFRVAVVDETALHFHGSRALGADDRVRDGFYYCLGEGFGDHVASTAAAGGNRRWTEDSQSRGARGGARMSSRDGSLPSGWVAGHSGLLPLETLRTHRAYDDAVQRAAAAMEMSGGEDGGGVSRRQRTLPTVVIVDAREDRELSLLVQHAHSMVASSAGIGAQAVMARARVLALLVSNMSGGPAMPTASSCCSVTLSGEDYRAKTDLWCGAALAAQQSAEQSLVVRIGNLAAAARTSPISCAGVIGGDGGPGRDVTEQVALHRVMLFKYLCDRLSTLHDRSLHVSCSIWRHRRPMAEPVTAPPGAPSADGQEESSHGWGSISGEQARTPSPAGDPNNPLLPSAFVTVPHDEDPTRGVEHFVDLLQLPHDLIPVRNVTL